MSHVKNIAALGSLLLLLAGCGSPSQQEPETGSHRQSASTTAQRSSSSSNSSSSQATSSKKVSASSSSQAKTATFSQQQFTINHVTFKLTGEKVTASATANRNLFVLYYTVTNHQAKEIIPADIWQAAVSATQNGKKLGTGNLAFTTSQTTDNNKLNRTVMPVKAGKTVTGLATFEPKTTQPVTITFKDTHHQVVHVSHYPLN
ncbi:DUF5067 domain-containing protein [Levilactobacillus enshiensis]|uniref:DUF5067 domain-containing protein n=1 Tax=Levilactobacillus enshiensis TaxID=2590213 RepID=UPI00117A8B20|nr:DUF5067 domain-containing protein [Levilactobacillus enshiensis]